MNRPTRKHQHLVQKIADKEARAKARSKKAGARLKQWKKWAEAYKGLVEST